MELPKYYRKKLIPGELFLPSDQELIHHYLQKKVMNRMPLQSHTKIHDVFLYNFHPKDLTGQYGFINGEDWYFFTPRNRKYPNGNRPNRSAGDGYWKPTGSDITIKKGKKEIGSKKCLDYYEGKHPEGIKTQWKMHEYTLIHNTALPNRIRDNNMDMKLDDWVLCKIYKKKDNTNKETGQISYTPVQHPNEEGLNMDVTSFEQLISRDHEMVEVPKVNNLCIPSNILCPNNIITPFETSGLLDHQGYLPDAEDDFPMLNLDPTMTSIDEQYYFEMSNQLTNVEDVMMNWDYKMTAGDYQQQQQQQQLSTTFFEMPDQIAMDNHIDNQLINAKPYEASGFVGLQGYLPDVQVGPMKNVDENKRESSSAHNQQHQEKFQGLEVEALRSDTSKISFNCPLGEALLNFYNTN